MGLHASIFRNDLGDCTNGGISSKANRVTIVNADGPFSPSEDAPAVMIIDHPAGPQYLPIAVPCEGSGTAGDPYRPQVGGMAGGNFVFTSDSRMDPRHPVSLHDRFER